MHHQGTIIRPPSEADSILLQVTLGCSHNACTFCPAYKDKPFAIKDPAIVEEDIRSAAHEAGDRTRIFLCDGDALILPQVRLVAILEQIRSHLPRVTRVGTYANAKSIARKSDKELRELRNLGLKIVHMGLESGDNVTLERVRKYGDCESIVAQGKRIQQADMKLFVTVIIGLAGKERSHQHAVATASALTKLQPDYTGALSLMLVPQTPLHQEWLDKRFTMLCAEESLVELRTMLEHIQLDSGLFYANHASNYLPLRIRFPRDKQAAIAQIDAALDGTVAMTPDWLRGL